MVLTLKKAIRSKIHLRYVSEHSCTICSRTDVQSAHIRYSGAGIGLKPCDSFVVPLCIEHHREQHGMNERMFWHLYQIDPIAKALSLCASSPDKNIRKAIYEKFKNHFDW